MNCPKCRFENQAGAVYCSKCATRLDGSGAAPSFTRTLETPGTELGRGTVFAGRFELIEELGAGGMGAVYRAFDKKVGEEIALKLLHPEIARDERTVERFRNEIKLARRITHKNVCRMHELHEEGKTLYLTMEYVRGEDLKSLIHRTKTLSIGTALSIARQVAEGLPDGRLILYVSKVGARNSRGYTLRVISPSGGEPRIIFQKDQDPTHYARPDSSRG